MFYFLRHFDVFGMSVDLGNVTSKTDPLVWAIGVIRDPSIQLTKLSGEVQLLSSYYRVNFTSGNDMVRFTFNFKPFGL